MKSLNRSLFFQLTFVLLMTSGFTCQKKYPEPPPEKEPSTEASDPSSDNSTSPSETVSAPENNSKNPVEKSDQ